MTLLIRPEAAADAAAIHAVITAAFEHAPHRSGTEAFIVRALRAAGELSVSLVAEEDEQIVGHVALSPVRILGADGNEAATGWHGLGPIAVLPERQGQGIGAQLMAQALAALRAHGAAGCVLLGEPAYYQRFGFRAWPQLVLPGVPPDYFMALAWQGAVPAGVVRYSDAFNATG